MARPLACILGTGDWPETNRAVASARRFGLDAAVGVSGAEQHGAPHADARRYPVEWRDDFADARNQLAERVVAEGLPRDYLLWLDSDEELIAYPEDDPGFEGPCAAALIIDRADLTPRAITRLQRRAPLASWVNAIHETVPYGGPGAPLIESILIRHHGYDDPARAAEKRRRNRRIVARERARGRDYFTLALEEARAATGGEAFMAWLRAFNHPEAVPAVPGGFDVRHEPAAALCAFDYRKPAFKVLAANPRIVDVQLAVLASEYQFEGAVDETRLAFVVELLATGGNDPRHFFPRALAGADRAGVLAWLADRCTPPGDTETGT